MRYIPPSFSSLSFNEKVENCCADYAGFASRPIFPRTVMIRTGRRRSLFRLKFRELSLRVKPIKLI